jgi:hypothetical protein
MQRYAPAFLAQQYFYLTTLRWTHALANSTPIDDVRKRST